jgi:hypothetical protein
LTKQCISSNSLSEKDENGPPCLESFRPFSMLLHTLLATNEGLGNPNFDKVTNSTLSTVKSALFTLFE